MKSKTWVAPKFCSLLILFLAVLTVLSGCGNGDWDQPPTSSTMTLATFSINGAPGTINEGPRAIGVTMPFGTDVTSLTPTFVTTGSSVWVGNLEQTSAVTANDFTNPVVYTVTAADGGTADYLVSVSLAPNTAKALITYSFVGFPASPAVINEVTNSITVTLPSGTDVTNLIANFATTGTSVKVNGVNQVNGSTANDFTNPVVYTVTAADASTKLYTVTVSVPAANASAKAMTAYSFAGYTGATGIINEAAKTINLTLPYGTDVSALIATYATTGTGVTVNAANQTSAVTPNDFTNPVVYTVTAADGTTADYDVSVSLAPNTAKALTTYSFVGFPASPGVINEGAKTLEVTLPSGTDVTNLIANFATTGTSVKVNGVSQVSGSTANDFTNPVVYTVTATDGTTVDYDVSVSLAPNTAKALTAYSFIGFPGSPGVINEAAKTVAVTLPSGTDVTNLVANFTTAGTNLSVDGSDQINGVTANDFTTPVDYTVTAADASTQAYTVSVSLLSDTLPQGPLPVNLGSAGNFAILAKSAISTTGATAVVGDLGISPSAASFITGFAMIADSSNTFATSPYVTGNIYAADYATPTPAMMTTAISDMEIAFTDAAGRTLPDFTELYAGDISGQTLTPGLYKWGTGVLITSAGVTLTGGADDVWIFQISQNLTVENSAIVTLSGGAQAKNIFWQVDGQATLGTAANFKGNLLTQTLISFNTGAQMTGRALAQTAVTLNATTITVP